MSFQDTMVVVKGHEAFRSAPCRFWINNGECSKGSACPFAHPLEDGTDLHDYEVDPNDLVDDPIAEGGETAPHEETLEEEQSEALDEAEVPPEEEEEEVDWAFGTHFGIFPGVEH